MVATTDPLVQLSAALAGRYTVERELGRGGMGTVYLAHDRKHGRRVAIKVLPRDLAAAIGPERFRLVVEDDGQGLPPDQRAEVLRRGARLDENAPGSGLGLSIIDDLARAYGGGLELGASALGGLRLEADLPRAAP